MSAVHNTPAHIALLAERTLRCRLAVGQHLVPKSGPGRAIRTMPPSLEVTQARNRSPVFKQALVQRRLVFDDAVVERSPQRAISNKAKGKRAVKPRTYGEGPLPFKPSDTAPRNAQIVGRVAEPGKQPVYSLKVGDIQVDDVCLHDILEYVSPYELERYEHQQFEEEREVLNASFAAAAEEEEKRRERHKARNKQKVVPQFEEIDIDEADHNGSAGGAGRARPTYKHLFQPPEKPRRRRKRDPTTNELLPLSDEEVPDSGDTGMESSKDGRLPSVSRAPGPAFSELQKRRRRKRDPITGELLPLSPLPESVPQEAPEPRIRQSPALARQAEGFFTGLQLEKRGRRRRHPVTQELMPLGWKYDSSAEQESHDGRRDGMSPSIETLSISHEQQPKRVKLASEYSADDISREHRSMSPLSRQSLSGIPKLDNQLVAPTIETLNNDRAQALPPSMLKSPPKTSMLNPTAQNSSSESSTEPVTLASFLKSSAARQDQSDSDDSWSDRQKPIVRKTMIGGKTSIMNPVATEKRMTDDDGDDGDDNGDDDSDLEEGEWFVEAIVGHTLSDPRTHPGKPSVMLYHTKWEGHQDLTWEPAESFSDPSTITDYRKRVGLDRDKQASRSPTIVVPVVASGGSASQSALTTKGGTASTSLPPTANVTGVKQQKMNVREEETSGDEGWEIEKILAHHMSDPRTHPGKPQTMLYRVKWAGFDESQTTWEPKESFPDVNILNAYRRQAGLKPEPRQQ